MDDEQVREIGRLHGVRPPGPDDVAFYSGALSDSSHAQVLDWLWSVRRSGRRLVTRWDEHQAGEVAAFLNAWAGSQWAIDRKRVLVDSNGVPSGEFISVMDAVPDGHHAFWLRRSNRDPYTAAEVLRLVAGGALGQTSYLAGDIIDRINRLIASDERLSSRDDALRFALDTTLNLYPSPPTEGQPADE